MEHEQPFESLDGHEYISLTTYRKTGQGVPTPVWFAASNDGQRLYVRTMKTSGKVKRIRNNPAVTIAPSDVRGKPLGDAFPAQARILPPEEDGAGAWAIRAKYGWKLFVLQARRWFKRNTVEHLIVHLEITPGS